MKKNESMRSFSNKWHPCSTGREMKNEHCEWTMWILYLFALIRLPLGNHLFDHHYCTFQTVATVMEWNNCWKGGKTHSCIGKPFKSMSMFAISSKFTLCKTWQYLKKTYIIKWLGLSSFTDYLKFNWKKREEWKLDAGPGRQINMCTQQMWYRHSRTSDNV